MKFKFLIAAILLIHLCRAQYNDAGLWLSCNIEKNLKGKFTALFNPVVRLNENVTEVGSSFLDGGVEYKINKHWKVSANYRFAARRRMDDSYGFRNRFYSDVAFRKKLKKLITISYRLRFQSQVADYFTSRNGKIPDYALRNKLQCKLDLNKKYAPYLSGELWNDAKQFKTEFTNLRCVAGIDYELSKKSGFFIAYIFQRELNAVNPITDYITSIGYSVSF